MDPVVRRGLLILAALATALAFFRRRPVSPPAHEGAWEPVEH